MYEYFSSSTDVTHVCLSHQHRAFYLSKSNYDTFAIASARLNMQVFVEHVVAVRLIFKSAKLTNHIPGIVGHSSNTTQKPSPNSFSDISYHLLHS